MSTMSVMFMTSAMLAMSHDRLFSHVLSIIGPEAFNLKSAVPLGVSEKVSGDL